MTSAAAFVEVFIPVVRDHGGNSAPQCANVRASFATARPHRHRTSRRLALPAYYYYIAKVRLGRKPGLGYRARLSALGFLPS